MCQLRNGLQARACRLPGQRGFTLLELIIVIAIIGILASIALPGFHNTQLRAREAVLKTDLRTMRDALDQFFADKGHYPGSLQELEDEGYLRAIPVDPITGDTDWVEEFEEFDLDAAETDLTEGGTPGVIDVHSAAEETSPGSETPYSEW